MMVKIDSIEVGYLKETIEELKAKLQKKDGE